ncbi:MAG TPA: heavy metal-associated domain-containing protein [Candidatus Thermoplasmatota archaeon]|nr:heavy metal-associated domain-containing protein [Candidatus Thermoplasmatota archaeon]
MTENEPLVLTVDGMTCGGCARTVERAASRVPGVTSARVNLNDATLTVSAAGAASRDAVAKAVAAAGYEVRGA